MLINKPESFCPNHVEFISYTGEYPTRCCGVLTLKIDGKEVQFGHNPSDNYEVDGNFDFFWSSGGCCGYYNNYTDTFFRKAEWEIDYNAIPDKYKKYADEIDRVFNNNVAWGCCGGCLRDEIRAITGAIKFLKAKDFMIKFEINGQKFFIKDRGGEGEHNVSLYKFVASPTGKYKIEFLKSANEPFRLSEYGVPLKAGATLNEIDKKKSIEKCASLGFTNYFCNEQ